MCRERERARGARVRGWEVGYRAREEEWEGRPWDLPSVLWDPEGACAGGRGGGGGGRCTPECWPVGPNKIT